ncbi:MAG: CaiB/BaiF CoA transferase family protein [Anaerolineae bacterium]
MTHVLQDITVIDLTQAMAGPYCTMLLGDMGAEVIKIERPGQGEQSRGWGPPFVEGESAYFLSVNRNKKSLTLNIGAPEGQTILRRLVAGADVFVCNIPRRASRERAGVDAATLLALNPRLIYATITGYGVTGPYADRPGYDMVAQGEAGLMSLTGAPDPNGEPYRYPIPMADITTGLYATIGILGALYARQQTGAGQTLDLSLLESQTAWASIVAGSYLNAGLTPARMGNDHPTIVPYQVFPAKDKYIIVAVGTEKLWAAFCRELDLTRLQHDPRFATNADRIAHRAEITALLSEHFKTQPAGYWLEKLRRAGIPNGPINRIPEAMAHPQHRARNFVVELEHPLAGVVKSLGNPVNFSDTGVSYRLPPPLLGEHTARILAGLNYTPAQIERLRQNGVV